jgi:hypothetical protein
MGENFETKLKKQIHSQGKMPPRISLISTKTKQPLPLRHNVTNLPAGRQGNTKKNVATNFTNLHEAIKSFY